MLPGGAAAAVVMCTNDLIDDLKGEFELPTIVYTPYTIFSNRIPLFDINFFNPMRAVDDDGNSTKDIGSITERDINSEAPLNGITLKYLDDVLSNSSKKEEFTKLKNEIIEKMNNLNWGEKVKYGEYTLEKRNEGGVNYYYLTLKDGASLYTASAEKVYLMASYAYLNNRNNFTEATNKMKTLMEKAKSNNDKKEIIEPSGDFVSPYVYYIKYNGGEFSIERKPKSIALNGATEYVSSASILSKPVASIYKSLRTVAIVALLTILVYAGIRMVLTSVARDKAKYRHMLIDWFIALVLVFVLHYLMSFVISISATLTKLVEGSSIENIMLQIPNGTRVQDAEGDFERLDEGDEGSDFWATNYIGVMRFYAGLVQNKGYTVKGITYTLMYVVVVIYMVIFTFQYLKRVLYMAFLTMISPLVAITYPLDKLNDGRAQGFSMWLKEYIFNALLQPIHCIIYVVIFGSVMELVTDYPLYGLIALGFMVPAEKFIRKLFGFEKASTVGGFGAMAGTAALMSGIQKLAHRPHVNKSSNNDEKLKLGDGNSNRGIKTIETIPTLGVGKDENNNIIPEPNENLEEIKAREQFMRGAYLDDDLKNNPRSLDTLTEEEKKDLEYYDEHATEDGLWDGKVDKTENNNIIPDNEFLDNKEITSDDRPKLSLRNGFAALGGHYARRLNNGVKNFHPIRRIGRGLAYGVGAATLGAVGLAAGIASGDAGKALQYTMAGGITGGNLGRNLGRTGSNVVGAKGAAKAFATGVLGERAEELSRQKYNQDFKNNVSNYDTAIRRVNNNGWKEMSKNGGIIDSSLEYGINDIGTMCNIYKTQQKLMRKGMGEDDSKKAAFRAYKLSSQYGDYSHNSKTQENLDKVLKSKGYSDSVKEKTKKEILDLVKTYKEVSVD